MDGRRTVPIEEVMASYSPERKQRIKARAAELIEEELALREIRKIQNLTQEEVAERLGGKQVYISRLEKRWDVKVSTLRDYVQALGGDLQLLVTLPEGKRVTIKDIGRAKESSKKVRKTA